MAAAVPSAAGSGVSHKATVPLRPWWISIYNDDRLDGRSEIMSEAADNPEVLEAVRLLVGDLVREKRYVMLPEGVSDGEAVIARFRTVSDAVRYAKRNDIDSFSLWTELHLSGGKEDEDDLGLEETFEESELDDELGDLLADDDELPDLEEDENLDDLL